MAISNMKATFQCDIQKIWNIVTSLDNYSWRSDLDRIEVIDENRFVEYTKEGYATTFTITNTEPCRRWEFDMNNDNMSGHWIGIFSYENGITTIDFTENVTAKKLVMKPFVKSYLNKQQSVYAADLERAVSML
ncbi:SRPBCC family protein [Faecalicatena contorta]|uniref:polyketide cyclase n=1 Tax=Faecalicatena contorta TaxID=39482 RepID=UPI00129DE1D9|nr:polyketide cyclase [Faecalicatena contorta]MEE0201966.1 polyketide cyclase [Muricomes sp.]MRM89599.1 polyketide cyclase [Faecalicatena contorta]DAY66445.1 MAG TPA: Protein XoxI, NESG, XoxI, Structural Genomics.48A [Caudoviricetes sp.]